MSQQTINIGSAPNDGTGDPLRTAFTKCNSNFTELYTAVSPAATVTSFNTRVGAISLSSLDVTNALTYTPLNKAGDTASGLITFTSGFVSDNLSTITKNTGSLSVIPSAPIGTVLRAINVDGTATRINTDSYVNAGTPAAGLTMRGARGTGAVPAAVVQGDLLGSISAHGFGATSFQAASTGLIGFVAEGTSLAAFTDSSQPTGITFQVTPNSSIAKAEQMHLSGSGVLTLLATVASTNPTTGNLVSSGGVGVTGAVNIGGSLALETINANAIVIGSLPASDSGTLLRLDQVDGTSAVALLNSYINAGSPNSKITLRGARGTGASPASIQSTDIIGGIGGEGYGTSFLGQATGQVNFVSEGAFTAISQPTAISFQVTASGSVAPSEQMRLTSAGVLTLASSTVSSTTGTGALVVTGGVGVGGAMNVGGAVAVTGALSAAGNDALLYTNTSGQSFTSGTAATVTNWTKTFDRLNTNFVPTTGIFTAPATGYYAVSAQLVFATAVAGAIGDVFEAIIVANGTTVATGVVYSQQTGTTTPTSVSVEAVVSLTAGQTIVLQGFQNQGGARTLLTTTAFNSLAINRIP
jgi:hypothetical protein